MRDLSALLLVLLCIAVMKWGFFPSKRRSKKASRRPGAGDGRGRVEERAWFLNRARAGGAGAGNGAGMGHGLSGGLCEEDARAVESYRRAALRGLPEGRVNLGYVYSLGLGVKKDYGQALRWFEQAAAGGDTQGKAGLAWLLATCPDGAFRDGQRAIDVLGPVVHAGQRDPALLDALAAACAEAGLFPDAVSLVTEAIGKEERASGGALYEQMRRRLRFYRMGKAWREPPEEADSEERPDGGGGGRSRQEGPAAGKPAVGAAPPLDREKALEVSSLIVGALVSGKYEDVYDNMSRTYRDAVPEGAIGTMIEHMWAAGGGRMVEAELAADEAGIYREADGEEKAKHTFSYAVRAEYNKETRRFLVEVILEGDRLACADFFYRTPAAARDRKQENTPA
jgi:hypothetical protein